MTFSSYPEYRNSEVDWLGEIPAAWDVAKFRHVFRESGEKIDDEVIGPMLSVSGYRGIEIKDYEDENQRRSDEDLIGYRVVRPGQLVVNTMWLNYAGLGVSEHEGHVSPAYRSYWIEADVDRRYIHHLMRSSTYVQGYTQLLTGIRPNSLQMSRDNLMGFPVLLPPRQDQQAIAAFLDRETAKIDALVAEQERLIALLKEKRQAVVSHAVTKGLNPDAPMKDSGIEWLGEVPAHWSVTRLKRLSPAITVGIVVNPSEYVSPDDGLPFLYGADIKEGTITWESARKIKPDVSKTQPKTVLDAGDIVTVRVGAPGVSAVVPKECSGGNCASVMLIKKGRWSSTWLCYAMNARSTRHQVEVVEYGAAQKQFNISHALEFLIPTPPPEEAIKIARHLDSQIAEFDDLIVSIEVGIKLAKERRAAIISAAVTGKIDVRGLVDQHEMETA